MSYIGRYTTTDKTTSFKSIDTFEAQFNGAQTQFTLLSSGVRVFPGTAKNLLVSLNGVIQEPITTFTVNGELINFTTAPAANSAFFGILMGERVDLPPYPGNDDADGVLSTQVFR